MTARLDPNHLALPYMPPGTFPPAMRLRNGESFAPVVLIGDCIAIGVEREPILLLRGSKHRRFQRAGWITPAQHGKGLWRIGGASSPSDLFPTLQDAWLGLFDMAAKLRPDAASRAAASKALEAERLARSATLLQRPDVFLTWQPRAHSLGAWQDIGCVGPITLQRRLFRVASYMSTFTWAGADNHERVLLHLADARSGHTLGWLLKGRGEMLQLARSTEPGGRRFAPFGRAKSLEAGLQRLIGQVAADIGPSCSAHQRVQMITETKALLDRVRRGPFDLLDRPSATNA